jgi:putative sterol carrier protein
MATYEFLSPEWVDAATSIRDEYADRLAPPAVALRVNLVVTDAPFADEVVRAYIDTSNGETLAELGILDDPDLTLTVDHATARKVFLGKDPSAALEAFMSGRIVVDGDMSRLFALQAQSVDPVAAEIAQRIAAMTAE